jgi:hypothetical protein
VRLHDQRNDLTGGSAALAREEAQRDPDLQVVAEDEAALLQPSQHLL